MADLSELRGAWGVFEAESDARTLDCIAANKSHAESFRARLDVGRCRIDRP